MKAWIGVVALVGISVAQAETQFEYPKLIECKPDKVVSVSLYDGIRDNEELSNMVDHTFEYVANGTYKFKSGFATFVTKLTNQGEVLNLYSGSATYSINMYSGVYVGNNSVVAVILPDKRIAGGTASGTLFEGKCKVNWN
jgi:hypothetical protein